MTETEKEFNDGIEESEKETLNCNSMKAAILKGARLGEFEDEKECIHWTICRDLHDTYAILIRLNDKLNRLETLMNGAEQHVSDESVEDTLLDLANYCIMELVERKYG